MSDAHINMPSGKKVRESDHVNMPSGKKLRESESSEDYISNLPECIISHILSRVPTEDVVRTSVLSRDWKLRWTSIYNIHINYNSKSSTGGERGNSCFLNFVDRVLQLTHDSRIKSFRLLCCKTIDTHRLTAWISAILSRGIQVLEIDVQGVVLPRLLASCTSLTELKISFRSCGSLQIPDKSCFRNLKRLCLDGKLGGKFEIMNLQNPDTSQLLLNFPVLETLELKYCNFLNVTSVEIWAPELIVFKAFCLFERNDCAIKIFGPKLAMFYSTRGYLHNFVLDAPSVYYVDLDHCYGGTECLETLAVRTHSLLKGFPGLKCLKLFDTVAQAYVRWRRGFNFPTFDQIKRLEIIDSFRSEPLLELLNVMPCLEYLNIRLWPNYEYDQMEPLPPRIVSSLKEVKFINFQGKRECGHFYLLKDFFENAKKLERVFVYLNKRLYMNMTGSEIRDKLSTLASKSSASVTISDGFPCSFEQESNLEAERVL